MTGRGGGLEAGSVDPIRLGGLVWVTRTLPAAEDTAGRLRALGLAPVVAPLLRVRRLAPNLEARDVSALAFTSVHGVAAFAALCPDRRRRVYSVGAGTGRAARAAGFTEVVSADGSLDDLVALIVGERGRLGSGVVLRPGAARPAGDIVGRLAAHGVPARSVAVYATDPTPLRGPLQRLWRKPRAVSGLLVYSARAARRLAQLCDGLCAPPSDAICMSAAVAEPLRGIGLASLRLAARPTETAMLHEVAAWARETASGHGVRTGPDRDGAGGARAGVTRRARPAGGTSGRAPGDDVI